MISTCEFFFLNVFKFFKSSKIEFLGLKCVCHLQVCNTNIYPFICAIRLLSEKISLYLTLKFLNCNLCPNAEYSPSSKFSLKPLSQNTKFLNFKLKILY